MRTERGVALPCSSQEDLARLNIVDMVSQHQPVHALQAVVGVQLFSQGPALRQQFWIAAAAVLLDPVLDDLPRLLGGAAVQDVGYVKATLPVILVQAGDAAPMKARDGTTLMNYVARPVGDGPFCIVMERTPYLRTGDGPLLAVSLLLGLAAWLGSRKPELTRPLEPGSVLDGAA